MKKLIFSFLIMVNVLPFKAQTIIAEYEQIHEIEEDSEMYKGMDQESVDELKAFLNAPEYFILTYSEGISTYKEKPLDPDADNEKSFSMGDENRKMSIKNTKSSDPDILYKDFNSQEIIDNVYLLGKSFIIEEPFQSFDWQLLDEEKTIGDFKVKKATANSEEGKVEAWYTEDIPIQDGPAKFYGLPGLIVTLKVGKVTFNLNALKMVNDNTDFEKPSKGKSINREKFEKLKEEKMNQGTQIISIGG